MKSLLHSSILAIGVSLTALTAALAADVKVTFVLANDNYEMDEVKGRGGFPRLGAALKSERAANPNTLFVHAGDLLSPSLFSGFDQGEHMIQFMNLLKTDVFTPGNHEYDFGKDIAAKRMGESQFPWIAANVTQADGTPVPNMAPTLVKEIAGVKVGFIGLAEETTDVLSSPGDLKFQPAYDTAAVKAKELREGGAEFVVAVNHNVRAVGQKLVDDKVVDLVLNGHNHDLWMFYNGRSAAVESASDSTFITAVDITFNIEEKDGKRTISWRPDFRVTDSADVTPDPDIAAKVAEYQAVLDKELDVEVGTTAIELDSRKASVRSQETTMGNLVADAMKKAVGADIAIANGGGIRGDTQYPAGAKLTRKHILTELPFGNKTVMIELTGAQVKEALENGVSKIEEAQGRFPQVSGIAFVVDKTKPAGERVSDIKANGQPLDEAATYKVATNDYMAGGGDGYAVFKGKTMLVNAESAKLLANDVMAYIREAGEVKGGGDPRIIFK
jgi:2',3'-cyclic-nucleotide 2'-phosphodiesterase (5'-nucleotidase family)